ESLPLRHRHESRHMSRDTVHAGASAHGRGSCPWDRAVLRRAGPPHAGVAGRRQTNEASGPASEGRPTVPTVLDGFRGAPETIRTPGLLIRSQTLYPAELRARGAGPASVPANKDSTACRTACKAGATRRREVVPVRGEIGRAHV